MESSLAALCHAGAKIVRLDAFGYATKRAGTRCFFEVMISMVDPPGYDVIETDGVTRGLRRL